MVMVKNNKNNNNNNFQMSDGYFTFQKRKKARLSNLFSFVGLFLIEIMKIHSIMMIMANY